MVLFVAAPAASQQVAKKATKRAAKEATESAAKQAAEEAAKKAAKKAVAPDAIDLNTATPEQLAKLGLDEATAKKVVDSRPFTGMDDAKIKEAIPAETLAKLQGKVTVKPPARVAKSAEGDVTMPTSQDGADPARLVSLADEDAVKEIIGTTVMRLWKVVNTLTRLRPSSVSVIEWPFSARPAPSRARSSTRR